MEGVSMEKFRDTTNNNGAYVLYLSIRNDVDIVACFMGTSIRLLQATLYLPATSTPLRALNQ